MKKLLLILTAFTLGTVSVAQVSKNPSFEEVISLQSPSDAVISPNGKDILYTSQTVDWKENRYDSEIWISKDGQSPFQLTNNLKNSSNSPKWSPDGKWIAFLSNRQENTQIHVIRAAGGESFQLTETKSNISDFEWSPDSKSILFLQPEDKSKEEKE